MARATLFDFNGVLVDDEHVHLACFREVVRPLGIEITDEAYKERYLGFDDVGAFTAMLADAGQPDRSPERVARLVEAKKPLYLAHARAGGLRVFPGAADVVRRCAVRGPVGIVSGALAAEIDLALGLMGVRELVTFVVPAERVTACKPDPEGYRIALELLGNGNDDTIVIEDSVAGVQAAKAAGLRCVAVLHSYGEAELRAAGADAIARTIADVDDALLDGP